ncbi:stage II sporulation protein M [bacterium]|nr:stage II sporulation protein M [bacterium]
MTRIILSNYFRELRGPLIFAVATFTVGILIGLSNPQYFVFFIRILKNMGADLLRHGRFYAAVSILAHNLMASYILIISGALFGIFPTLALALNGAILGAAVRYIGGEVSRLLFHVAPHGVFELPAYFICAAIALHCGQASIQRLGFKEIVARWLVGTRVFLRIVFPLLVVAAFIEAFISISLP